MKLIIAAFAALTTVSTAATAQQTIPEALFFAKKVASATAFEIQSSQLAKQQSQSDAVRAFADQMIADHTKAADEFKAALQAAQIFPPPVEEPNPKQQATLSRLRAAHGASFDTAYVSAQLGAHKEAVVLFQTYARRARPPELKEFAQKMLPTLQHHLSMVQTLSASGGVAGLPAITGSGSRAIGPPVEKK
jgi:putative membrane protein